MAKIMEKTSLTIEELRKKGIPVVPGNEYFKDWPFNEKTSLREVRKRLAKIKGSLSDELIKMRSEERP